jgi:hypothetical protein
MPSQSNSDITSNSGDISNRLSSLNQIPVKTQEEIRPDVGPSRARSPSQNINGVFDRSKARQKLIKRFRKLNEIRQDVLDIRVKLEELRCDLARERKLVNIADEQLILRLRLVWQNKDHDEFELVLDGLQKLQEARGKLWPMEDDYNKLEAKLNVKEFELMESESKFYQQSASSHASLLADEELAILERSHAGPSSVLSTQASYEQQGLPLDGIPFSVDHASQLRIELGNLEWEVTKLEDEGTFLASIGQSLDDDAREELDVLKNRHKITREKLETVEMNISRMNERMKDASFWLGRCDEGEAVEDDGRDDMQNDEIVGDLYDQGGDHYRDCGPSISCRPHELPPGLSFHPWRNRDPVDFRILDIDPLLYSVWRSSPVFARVALDRRRDALDRSDYINTWLLDGLRSSKIQVSQYSYHAASANLSLRLANLKNLVLRWWHEDVPGSGEHPTDTIPAEGHFSLLTAKSTQLNRRTQTDPGFARHFD